jgi:valyl-tRNA synthetase
LYQFLWHEYCDWYLEIVKNRLAAAENAEDKRAGRTLLVYVLEQSLRLLHPIMPFITEEIWQRLPHQGSSVMVAPWPQADSALSFPDAVESMTYFMEITREVRNIRSSHNIPPAQRVPLILRTTGEAQNAILRACQGYLVSLGRLSSLEFGTTARKPALSATAVVKGVEVYVSLEDVIDLEEERRRLGRELQKAEQALERVNKKLDNEEFLSKAPAAVVSRERASRQEFLELRTKLRESLRQIETHGAG